MKKILVFLSVCLLICEAARVQAQKAPVTIRVEKTNIAFKMPDNNFQFTKGKKNRTWEHKTKEMALTLMCFQKKKDVTGLVLSAVAESMYNNMRKQGANVRYQSSIENIPNPNKTGRSPYGLIIQEKNQITVSYYFGNRKNLFIVMVTYLSTAEIPYGSQNIIKQIPEGGQDFIKSIVYIQE